MAYSLAAWVASHEAFLDLVYEAAGDPTIKVKSSGGTTLAEMTLGIKGTPGSSVNAETGALTLSIVAQEDASTAGVAAFVQLCDGAGAVHCELPATEGTVVQPGYAVFNSLTIIEGQQMIALQAFIAPDPADVIGGS